MKQKIVITMCTVDNEKTRRKALKIAVSQAGVYSVALKGDARNQIEVIGDRVDMVQLTTMLRKKVGYADLISVNSVTEDKKPATKPLPTPMPKNVPFPYPIYQVPFYYGYEEMNNEPSCNIL